MFLGIIFVEKLPVLFDARGVHDNFCQDCSYENFDWSTYVLVEKIYSR